MKKIILIIIGSIIILLLIAVWVYLLFFNTPTNPQDVFSNLNIGNDKNTEIIDDSIKSEEDKKVVNIDKLALRQLTTRAVAGFGEVSVGQVPIIYYSEKGTGHIYTIDLFSGEETRISGTTIPDGGVYSAKFSPKGDFVVLGIKSNTKSIPLVIGKIGSSTNEDMSIENFDTYVDQFTVDTEGELLYAVREDLGLGVYSYNFDKHSKKKLFDIPFHEAIIQWGDKADDTHYFYPKASYLLEGYLYQVKNKKISRVPVDGNGLSSLANNEIVAYTKFADLKTQNFLYNRNTGENTKLRVSFLPEKCVIGITNNIICAYEDTEIPVGYPDTWYQGSLGFSDSLWLISGNELSVQMLIDIQKESGRKIDVTDLATGNSGIGVYFINKNDNTLWMYKL